MGRPTRRDHSCLERGRRFRIFGSDFTFVVPLRASVLAVEFIIAAMVIIGVLLRPPPVYASRVPPCSDPPTRRVLRAQRDHQDARSPLRPIEGGDGAAAGAL